MEEKSHPRRKQTESELKGIRPFTHGNTPYKVVVKSENEIYRIMNFEAEILINKEACLKEDPKITELNQFYMKQEVANFYNKDFFSAAECVLGTVLRFDPNLPYRYISNMFSDLTEIGVESAYGKAFNGKFMGIPDMFVVKEPTEKYLNHFKGYDIGAHEFFVATSKKFYLNGKLIELEGTNSLRQFCPNYSIIIGGFLSRKINATSIIMEKIVGKDLGDIFKTVSESKLIEIVLQLALAFKIGIERIGFYHRDAHHGNIMMRETALGQVKYETKKQTYYIKTNSIPTLIDYGKSFSEIEIQGMKISNYVPDFVKFVDREISDIFRVCYLITLYRKSFYPFFMKIFKGIVSDTASYKDIFDDRSAAGFLEESYGILTNRMKFMKNLNGTLDQVIRNILYSFDTTEYLSAGKPFDQEEFVPMFCTENNCLSEKESLVRMIKEKFKDLSAAILRFDKDIPSVYNFVVGLEDRKTLEEFYQIFDDTISKNLEVFQESDDSMMYFYNYILFQIGSKNFEKIK